MKRKTVLFFMSFFMIVSCFADTEVITFKEEEKYSGIYEFKDNGYFSCVGQSPEGVAMETVARRLAEEDCMRYGRDFFVEQLSYLFEDASSTYSNLDFRSQFYFDTIVYFAQDFSFYNFEFFEYETQYHAIQWDDVETDFDFCDCDDGYMVVVFGGFSAKDTFALLRKAAELKFKYAFDCEVPESTTEIVKALLGGLYK